MDFCLRNKPCALSGDGVVRTGGVAEEAVALVCCACELNNSAENGAFISFSSFDFALLLLRLKRENIDLEVFFGRGVYSVLAR